ncbi:MULTISPECIES: sigma-70 family RNA polymerase sigma factor [Vibrio]|uniref:RNA polymerase subunit sigma n=2 Tax=Vibrio casei TaxID=673372 RepID=A0A368LP31_9VIBR|nr:MULTISPECIES: sigma-70 family RNA polymerase sigma factor [Vibrio]RCS73627.1 RNA polymerase subunit sigma [Vibrio casei]SJN16744.1 RNA polymerase sigma-70 factor [Vibrio casei]HBV76356.1 RNA polymerase subunit sigma [Vibrio sp.]
MRTESPDTDALPPLELWLCNIANQRDKQSFEKLFRWFAPKIQRFGIKQFNNPDTAKELLQDTMTNVWKKAHLFDMEKGAATTWVYAIMRNTSFDMLRKMRSQKEDQLSDDIWPLVEAENVEVQGFDDHLLSKKVARHLDRLSYEQRQLIEGVYFKDLSQEQLAAQFNIPLGTVKSRLRLAIQKLKHLMGEHS